MKALLYLLLACTLFCVQPIASKASHFAAAQITYKHVQGDTFQIKLTIYYDCSGIPASNQESIAYFNKTNQSNPCQFGLLLTGVDSGIITAPCGYSFGNSCTNPPGPLLGYRKREYTNKVVLPIDPSDTAKNQWTFWWQNNARNGAITNLNNPGVISVKAYLDRNILPENNSAIFTSEPPIYLCKANSWVPYGTIDPDNDSLSFVLIPAIEASSCTMGTYTYNTTSLPGCSGANPIGSLSPPIISQVNGDVMLPPAANSFFTIAAAVVLQCSEWRQHKMIGSIMRDQMILFRDLDSCTIAAFGYGINIGGGIVMKDTAFANCLTNAIHIPMSISYQCNSLALDGSDFNVVSATTGAQIPLVAAHALNCVQNLVSDSIELIAASPFLANDTLYIISQKGTDSNTLTTNCGIRLPEGDTLILIINNCALVAKPQSITNVSVNPGDTIITIYWNAANQFINQTSFNHWELTRAANGQSIPVANLTWFNGRKFYHTTTGALSPVNNPSVSQSYYAVVAKMNNGLTYIPSDSVATMHLTFANPIVPTDSTLHFVWTRYWAFRPFNQLYELQTSTNPITGWATIAYCSLGDTSTYLARPLSSGYHYYRIAARKYITSFAPQEISYSNTIACSDLLSASIAPVYKKQLNIPTAFTPNDDGLNDAFFIPGLEPNRTYSLIIENRYGQTVFESNNYQNNWKATNLPAGDYFYRLTQNNSNLAPLSGSVQVVR